MSVLFALLPLLRTWYVSPLEVLRVDEQGSKEPLKVRLLVFTAIITFLFLFSFWLLKDALLALGFIVTTLIAFATLAGVALLCIKGIRRYFPKSWGFTARQSLLNLFRPNNQTVVLIVAIGLGTSLISTLYFTKDILLAKTDVGQNSENANIIILDVQSEQSEAVELSITSKNLPIIDNIPIVTMRMHKIKGQLVNDLRQDSTKLSHSWVINHEFRSTYRNALIDSENVIEGEWTPQLALGEPIVISIANNVAEQAELTIGDAIVFNVQGVLMETTIGSIREVDWRQLQPNFNIVFPKGVLEQAPQFNVILTSVKDETSSADLQRDLVAKYPNLSIIDLRQVYDTVENILDKVSWVINFMAFFSIITGIIVLIGSVRTSKYQRIKESVLLRTLGAKNKQILQISAFEYLFLGLIGSLVGILLALLSSLCLALLLFNEPFTPSIIPFVVFLPGITLLVLGIGLSNIRSVLSSTPLEVLRRES